MLWKYKDLGTGDGVLFWQKFKWVVNKSDIDELKARVEAHTAHLNLCMTTISKYVSFSLSFFTHRYGLVDIRTGAMDTDSSTAHLFRG
jgi:hypothetical protein